MGLRKELYGPLYNEKYLIVGGRKCFAMNANTAAQSLSVPGTVETERIKLSQFIRLQLNPRY